MVSHVDARMIREDDTFEVLCGEEDRPDVVFLDELPYLRSYGVALESHLRHIRSAQ